LATKEILDEVERIYEEKLKEEPLVEVELENTTPAFVWGWRGDAWLDPKKCLVEGPRPTAIAGKLRWWIRSLVTSKIRIKNYKKADAIVRELMGGIPEGDGRKNKDEKPMASGIVVQVDYISDKDEGWEGWKRVPLLASPCDLQIAAFDDTQKCLKVSKLNTYTEGWMACYRLSCLLNRVTLVTRGCYDKLKDVCTCSGKVPSPPKFYKFKLIIRRRLGWKLLGVSPDNTRHLLEPFMKDLLVLFAMTDGIGGASTRGYGRLSVIRGLRVDKGTKIHTLIGRLLNSPVIYRLRSREKELGFGKSGKVVYTLDNVQCKTYVNSTDYFSFMMALECLKCPELRSVRRECKGTRVRSPCTFVVWRDLNDNVLRSILLVFATHRQTHRSRR